jgi:hypothetical protein
VINWLNANAGTLSLVFSFVVAAATVAYVVLTRQLVRETRAVREAQLRPHVAVRVQINEAAFSFVDLIVENLGPGPAYDVSFLFQPDLELEENPKRRLSDIGFLRNGFRYLPPGQPTGTFLTSLIGVGNEKLEGPAKLRFTVDVCYRDVLHHQFTDQFEIDFAHFVGMSRIGAPPLPEIAKHLEKLAESLRHIESGWSKVKTIQYTPDDVEREHDRFRLAQLSRQIVADTSQPLDETKKPDDAA